ncbi:hypothetical protein [Chloroflexus sp.]|uniref:hypothetical protein n=1 Tax=Chloroflexus sp. TaxID=1904827 RepID=UPI0026247F6B|nr:hypothetical protein [uncultured Chloroflexus sp.]
MRTAIVFWLGNQIRQEWRALRAPALWLALVVIVASAVLSAQLPHQYTIDVGYEEGVGNADLPLLRDFNTSELYRYGQFRWTAGNSSIDLPGIGTRNTVLVLSWLPIGDTIVERVPSQYQVWIDDQLVADIPTRSSGGRDWLVLPADTDGRLRIRLVSDTFRPEQDPRLLGLPLDRVVVIATATIPTWPELEPLGYWLGAMLLGWLILYRTLNSGAVWGLAIGTGALAIALLIDPVRSAFGAQPAFTALILAYPLTLAAQTGLRAIIADHAIAHHLSAIAAISFATRIGGRFYPASMHGDIGFHTNRFHEALGGLITIVSRNRGIDFPYPPGPYLLLAPGRVLGIETPLLLQIGAALADSLGAIMVYFIARRALAPRPALLAAGIYAFTAATYLTTWWSFDTHIITQFLYLTLIWVVIRAWEDWQAHQYQREWALGVAAMCAAVCLGHFGFLISTVALLGLLLTIVWPASWMGAAWAQRVRWPLTIGIGVGLLFAIIFFYSAYIPMFLKQLETAREGGLSAVANRAPVSRDTLWQTLWQAGLIAHYGFLPLPFAIVGLWLVWRWQGWQITTALMGLSWVVAIIFAVLPFITLVSNSPRYLMALGWAIALGAAATTDALWRRGWAGKLSVIGAGALVLLNTLWYWLTPMLWRARPPEPF